MLTTGLQVELLYEELVNNILIQIILLNLVFYIKDNHINNIHAKSMEYIL